MKKNLCIAAVLFVFSLGKSQAQTGSSYLKENFAITKVIAVKVAKLTYVKQIFAKDYKINNNSFIAGFGIENEFFTDNGKGNDKIANDGIYTSIDTYPSTTDRGALVVLSENRYYDIGFKYVTQITKEFAGKVGVGISCEIIGCTCAECHCRACEYGWGQNLNWCFKIGKCSISIDF